MPGVIHAPLPKTHEARGFAICGADKKWQNATGKVTGTNTVEVWSENIAQPVAVRYAWADNPECNLYAENGLPVHHLSAGCLSLHYVFDRATNILY